MTLTMLIVICVVAVVVGVGVGYWLGQRREHATDGPAETRADQRLQAATDDSESIKRKAELEAKELLLEAKTKAEDETKHRLKELQEERSRLLQREEAVDKSEDELRGRGQELSRKEKELGRREQAAESMARNATDMLTKAEGRLERLAQLSADQAREMLIEQLRDDAHQAAAKDIARIERETEQQARERATTIIATAIQRFCQRLSWRSAPSRWFNCPATR